MADHEASKIDKANHLLLDQPLLRLPYELLRKNFRSAHFIVEKESVAVKNALKEAATASLNGHGASASGQEDLLKSLDAMVARMRGVKRKLAACADEEAKLYRQVDARTAHLAELASMHTLDDVAYEAWSRRRLDRLLVDYLLRHGYNASAQALVDADDAQAASEAKDKNGVDGARGANGAGDTDTMRDTDAHEGPSGAAPSASGTLRDLVDIDTFSRVSYIRQRLLQHHSVTEALAWCVENKKELRKNNSKLEFMLRLQQFIEMARSQDPDRRNEAVAHARKYLTPHAEMNGPDCRQAAALLCYSPEEGAAHYNKMWRTRRWMMLADLFTSAHNQLLSLPSVPLLHLALSTGLQALKTPACHSTASASATGPSAAAGALSSSSSLLLLSRKANAPTPAGGDGQEGDDAHGPSAAAAAALGPHNNHHPASHIGTSVCPICSPELNELARHVPYAHHSKSHVENDLMLLPNGRAYGRARLDEYARKAGLPAGHVRDLRTGDVYRVDQLVKVYIT